MNKASFLNERRPAWLRFESLLIKVEHTRARKLAEQRSKERAKPERIESHLGVDALELQIGLGLVRIVDRSRGGDLLVLLALTQRQESLALVHEFIGDRGMSQAEDG